MKYNYIINPFTLKTYSIKSKKGKYLIKKYINNLIIGGNESNKKLGKKITKDVLDERGNWIRRVKNFQDKIKKLAISTGASYLVKKLWEPVTVVKHFDNSNTAPPVTNWDTTSGIGTTHFDLGKLPKVTHHMSPMYKSVFDATGGSASLTFGIIAASFGITLLTVNGIFNMYKRAGKDSQHIPIKYLKPNNYVLKNNVYLRLDVEKDAKEIMKISKRFKNLKLKMLRECGLFRQNSNINKYKFRLCNKGITFPCPPSGFEFKYLIPKTIKFDVTEKDSVGKYKTIFNLKEKIKVKITKKMKESGIGEVQTADMYDPYELLPKDLTNGTIYINCGYNRWYGFSYTLDNIDKWTPSLEDDIFTELKTITYSLMDKNADKATNKEKKLTFEEKEEIFYYSVLNYLPNITVQYINSYASLDDSSMQLKLSLSNSINKTIKKIQKYKDIFKHTLTLKNALDSEDKEILKFYKFAVKDILTFKKNKLIKKKYVDIYQEYINKIKDRYSLS